MSIERKILGTSPSGDAAPNVEDVFSTYLYEGTGSAQTITNGIDLDGEGGMVWIKGRNATSNHALVDTERGGANSIASDTTAAQRTDGAYGLTFNSDGFDSTGGNLNVSGREQASWTFRKAPRFFDVVTYTGNGVAGRQIAHDLGVAPGMIIIKQLNTARNWEVYHRSLGIETGDYPYTLRLNSTSAQGGNQTFFQSGITSSEFKIAHYGAVNQSGGSYVAYLFAHDPDGEDDDGMIACGSWASGFTGNISLGWEPQYMLWKASSGTGDWKIFDSMRGIVTGGNDAKLKADESEAETSSNDRLDLNADGFSVNANFGEDFIYMAIRAPMMKEPEAGTDVFAVDTQDGTPLPSFKSTFPIDMQISRYTSAGTPETNTRLTDKRTLETSSTSAEGAKASASFAFMNGWGTGTGTDSTYYSWMWKRAKGFFDVVAYTGNGTAGRTVNHSLGVAPEMMWVKKRGSTGSWWVYHSGIGNTKCLQLNDVSLADSATKWNNTSPTDSLFYLDGSSDVNGVYQGTYIAYLFATLDGVSKCGSYTGNGSSQNIDCGFSAGARFVLIKRTDSTGDWFFWDTERGIVAGNDPHLSLNTTAAQVTSDDSIDPQSAGFTVNQVSATNINVSSGTYIFLAIA